jgi:hypothetical protein
MDEGRLQEITRRHDKMIRAVSLMKFEEWEIEQCDRDFELLVFLVRSLIVERKAGNESRISV